MMGVYIYTLPKNEFAVGSRYPIINAYVVMPSLIRCGRARFAPRDPRATKRIASLRQAASKPAGSFAARAREGDGTWTLVLASPRKAE